MSFANKVYMLLRQIPKGKVTTYKILAEKLNTKAYRAVGQALKRNPNAPEVPCHRVVNSNGDLGGYNGHRSGTDLNRKIKLLTKEGINIENKRIINFDDCLHKFL